MIKDIKTTHKEAYRAEKRKRWVMEEQSSNIVIKVFIDHILKKFPFLIKEKIDFQRFDEMWFASFPPEKNEWVKGCPDFRITLTNQKTKHLFLELKIKESGIFRKTLYGGKTPYGSSIPKYGCCSFYLDVIPVHKNMNDFCLKTGLPTSKFLILFSNKVGYPANMFFITLAKINNILKTGWKGMKIAEFGEEYGQKTYLIPQEITTKLSDITNTYILSVLEGSAHEHIK